MKPAGPGSSLVVALVLGCLATACPDRVRHDGTGASSAAAPSGSALSAPIASESELLAGPETRLARVDADTSDATDDHARTARKEPPQPLREDMAPPTDSLRRSEMVGISLKAHWRWDGVPAGHAGPEVAKAAVDAARSRATLNVDIDLAAPGRMRWIFAGRAFTLPVGTELRARYERYGHLLLWPDRRQYRVLPAGTLRSLFAEHRADTLPLSPGTVREQPSGSLLGFDTTRVEVSSQLGRLVLDQAEVPTAGAGAPLLCRLLMELVGVEPSSPVCREGEVALRAEYEWADGGKIGFGVTDVLRGQELSTEDLLVPPTQMAFRPDGLPPPPAGILVTATELHTFRTHDIASADEQDAGAPEDGVLAENRTDVGKFLLLDGVPVSWVRARSQQHVTGPRPGRYVVSWRDFLGLTSDPARAVDVPCRVVAGTVADGGAPEP